MPFLPLFRPRFGLFCKAAINTRRSFFPHDPCLALWFGRSVLIPFSLLCFFFFLYYDFEDDLDWPFPWLNGARPKGGGSSIGLDKIPPFSGLPDFPPFFSFFTHNFGIRKVTHSNGGERVTEPNARNMLEDGSPP